MDQKIEHVIAKYLSHEATMADLDILEEYVSTKEGQAQFKNFVKTSYLAGYYLNDLDTEKEVAVLKQRIREAQTGTKRWWSRPSFKYAAAAALVGIVVAAYLSQVYVSEPEVETVAPVIVENTIEPGSTKSILTLADGSEVVLEKGLGYRSENAQSDGESLAYTHTAATTTEMAYNTLTIPRGGQFSLTLADGTKVWLNSDTQLKYPVAFQTGRTRQIELMYGEAYFEVSPSTEHQGAGFEVLHPEQTVQVLGTEFNIKAYAEEDVAYTTLVEGKVSMAFNGNTLSLEPHQQFTYNFKAGSSSVSSVDVFDVVSWKEGVFSFNHASLGEIMKVLERWYDMEVVYGDAQLKEVKYSGSINKRFEIQDILSALMQTNTIHTYEINKNTIVLK
ncbi:MAG: FecR family protein [Flavobacteriaceae bacterium]|nr:FecR family protein [Flavobacteriaceae bacterium]